ncbi:maleylpyruvate isomerase N-terminal domain-containing protein [Actinokineospora inagensis]|uniref:maleylpyruvate isomerase N-terminal domain-containing protein n=1 Tax=Actinokineospora inagensis TaxID=103730 RepID=UPI0003F79F3F|nr:maleylpyruvate isomerase N-terminal domain-containing protein [Actinokineospora inagensis]
MNKRTLVEGIITHAAAIEKIVLELAPDAPIPTCPEWTLTGLVGHLGRINDAALKSLDADPAGTWPPFVQPPQDWESAFAWWQQRGSEFLERLPDLDPAAPSWVFSPGAPRTVEFWLGIMAHEMALHRLDAEYALRGADQPDLLTFGYQPDFAADGVHRFLTAMIPSFVSHREPIAVTGTVLVHARDVDRFWLMRLVPDRIPEVTVPDSPVDADVVLAGSAEGVYRALWGRPTTATTTGDAALLYGVRAP